MLISIMKEREPLGYLIHAKETLMTPQYKVSLPNIQWRSPTAKAESSQYLNVCELKERFRPAKNNSRMPFDNF